MTRSDLREAANISITACAVLEGYSLSKEYNCSWDKTNIYKQLMNESLHTKRMKNLARWEIEGGGPLADIGFDRQRQKRVVQDVLNLRLARQVVHNPMLYGGIVLLTGEKLIHAVEPYERMHLSELTCIAETDKLRYVTIRNLLDTFKDGYERVQLYREPLDIIEVSKRLMRQDPNFWRGFDFDFDTSLSEEKRDSIEDFICKIDTHSFWLRVTATQRPIGLDLTEKRLNDIIDVVILNNWQIEDLAYGRAFTYCDTAAMSTMQVICTRR